MKKESDRVLLMMLALAAVIGLLYNGAILIGFGPDEARHINYVKLLLDEHRLPRIESVNPYVETGGAHAFHPPLYYLILLPFYALSRGVLGENAWHLVRLISLALCLGALPMIYQIARRIGSVWFARLVVAQIALLPIWGMTAATINNDSAAFFAVTLFLWLLTVKFNDLDRRACWWLGVAMGLGGLCKATALLCDGAALLLFLLARDGKAILENKAAWRSALMVLLVGAVIVSPWHIRSMLLYHTWTPLPQSAPLLVFPPPPAMPTRGLPPPSAGKLMFMAHPDFPAVFAIANWRMFYTLWSQRDWLWQRVPDGPLEPTQSAIYLALAAYTLLAAIGALLGWQRAKNSPDEAARPVLWPCYGAFVLTWLTVLEVALFMHWGWSEGGRYLLPALCGFSLFLARGWRGLAGEKILPALTWFWLAAGLALNGLSLYWLLAYLNPTFGPK